MPKRKKRIVASLIAAACIFAANRLPAASSPTDDASLQPSPYFNERVATLTVDPDVRIHVNAPAADPADAAKPTRVIVFALPNGNTLEQTLGCKMVEGLDWHYDIQHIAAQVRLLRSITPDERIVLVCAEAKGLSWPSWRASHQDANKLIAGLVDDWRTRYGGHDAKVTLTGHSGGGGFMFSVVEAGDKIPDYIDRIAYLDANYNFDAATHEAKFADWLRGDSARRLVVICYDDRNIMLDGKKVVGPTGGTYRATGRMIEALGEDFPLTESTTATPPFIEHIGLDGRIHFYAHPNSENKILHTVLVGEMNGLVHAQTLGTPLESKWGAFGGPRAYEKWIQPGPAPFKFPARPNDALSGSAFAEKIKSLDRDAREAAILDEVARGNIPDFERQFIAVPIEGKSSLGSPIRGTIEVMPDCLAVGNDADFLRIPMRPETAQKIADLFGCVLPTRKMVDAMDAAATVRLEPQPLTEDRESIAAFVLENQKIEQERAGKPLGGLVAGAKKDIVVSNKIYERPDRLVIYGWRQLNGEPIQPLTNVHVNWYVDYSHGVRLVRATVLVGDFRTPIEHILVDSYRCGLLSDEGVINPPRYPLP